MVNRKYQLDFEFFDTEQEAKEFCDKTNKAASRYVRTKSPAHYTPWESQDHTEHKFIAWYRR